LRLAYFQLSKDNVKITAGQDRAIVAPLDPVSLSHVAIPLGATGPICGHGCLRCAWTCRSQSATVPQHGSWEFYVRSSRIRGWGIYRPWHVVGSFSRSGGTYDAALLSNQTRFKLSFNGSNGTIGAGLHYGRERIGADRTVESWAFALDYSLPVHPKLRWRGELFVGSNLVPFQGGIIQGIAFVQPIVTNPPTQLNRIGAGGGWTELIIRPDSNNRNVFYAGVGEDDPRDRHLLPGSTRSRNAFVWASYFRKLSDQMTAAFEWSNWQFKTRGFTGTAVGPQGPAGSANVFNLALAFQF
jgi:hypothetical protein